MAPAAAESAANPPAPAGHRGATGTVLGDARGQRGWLPAAGPCAVLQQLLACPRGGTVPSVLHGDARRSGTRWLYQHDEKLMPPHRTLALSEQKTELSQREAPRAPLGASPGPGSGPWARGRRAGVAAEGTWFIPGDGHPWVTSLWRTEGLRGGGRGWGGGTDPSHSQGSRAAPRTHQPGL